MSHDHCRHPAIADAHRAIDRFVTEVTGQTPTPQEVAAALKRYFVLKEIVEHIQMDRDQATDG